MDIYIYKESKMFIKKNVLIHRLIFNLKPTFLNKFYNVENMK